MCLIAGDAHTLNIAMRIYTASLPFIIITDILLYTLLPPAIFAFHAYISSQHFYLLSVIYDIQVGAGFA